MPEGDVFTALHAADLLEKEAPPKDPWDIPFHYVAPNGTSQPFYIRSDGPDRTPSTQDDIEIEGEALPPSLNVPLCARATTAETKAISATHVAGFHDQARIIPNFEKGEALGMKLFSVEKTGVFAKAGIRNGEVIYTVDDEPLMSPDAMLAFLERLNNKGKIDLVVGRKGEFRCLKLTVE